MFSRILLYLVIVVCEVLAISIFFEPERVVAEIEKEHILVLERLGEEQAIKLALGAKQTFTTIFVDTGIVETTYKMFIPTDEEVARSRGMQNLGKEFFPKVQTTLRSFWNGIYQSVYRLHLLFEWKIFFLALFIPACIDGFTQREIKKTSYGYASPVRYHASLHMLVLMVMMVPFYMFFPWSLTPMAVPIWGVCMSLVLLTLTSNVQKKI